MAYYSRAWATALTEAQRQRWIVAGANVLSASRLKAGPLTGEQHFVGIHAVRACCDQPGLLLYPPAREVFPPMPVAGLTVVNGEQGVRFLLSLNGPVTEDIMVFGQAPCSAGRSKRRNVAFLGLLPPPENGVSDITDLYVAKYGAPKPGQKVFIVTRQHKNGWEGPLKESNDIVPGKEAGEQELQELQGLQELHGVSDAGAGTADLAKGLGSSRQAATEAALPLKPYMHTGCPGVIRLTPPAPKVVQSGSSRTRPRREVEPFG